MNLPGPNRFLVLMSFLLLITLMTYRNMLNRAKAEEELKDEMEKLRGTIDSKNSRIREIHHRIKNNLQVLSSMVGMQATKSQNIDVKERMKQCQSRIQSIAMIHDLLNDSDNGEELDMKPYLEQLIYKSKQFLNQKSKEFVDINTDIDRITVDAETATSCGLVVSELLTNCFKHAFEGTDEDRIDIQFEQTNGHVELTVKDNGNGIAGGELDPSESFGHEIVHSIVESDLEGTVDMRNTDDGANVQITFPTPDLDVRRN